MPGPVSRGAGQISYSASADFYSANVHSLALSTRCPPASSQTQSDTSTIAVLSRCVLRVAPVNDLSGSLWPVPTSHCHRPLSDFVARLAGLHHRYKWCEPA